MYVSGLWDIIFNREIVPVVEGVRRWEACFEEREKHLKKLNLDLATIEADDVATGDNEDPVNKFRRMFCKTGTYLRPDDMKFCICKTNFTEDQIIEWFHRFKTDCPNGRLTNDQLRKLFRQAYPYGRIRFGQYYYRHNLFVLSTSFLMILSFLFFR